MSGPQIKLLDGSFTFGEKDPAPNYPRYEREFSLLTKSLKQEQESPLDFKGKVSPLWRLARLRCLIEIERIRWCKALRSETDEEQAMDHLGEIRDLSHQIGCLLDDIYPSEEKSFEDLPPQKMEREFYEISTSWSVKDWQIGGEIWGFGKRNIKDTLKPEYSFLLDSIQYMEHGKKIGNGPDYTHVMMPLMYNKKWYNNFSKTRRQRGISTAEDWHEEFTLKSIPMLLDAAYLNSTLNYPSDTLQDHIKFCDRQLRCIGIFNEFVFHNQDIIDLVGDILSEFKQVRSLENMKEWKIFLGTVNSLISPDEDEQKKPNSGIHPPKIHTTQNIEQQVHLSTDEHRKQAYDNAETKIRELLNAGVKDDKQIVKSMPPELLLPLTNHALGRILNGLKGKSLGTEACKTCGKRARQN